MPARACGFESHPGYNKYFMVNIDEQKFIEVCNTASSMAQASQILGLHFNTFKKYAIKFGCYKPIKVERVLKVNLVQVLIICKTY